MPSSWRSVITTSSLSQSSCLCFDTHSGDNYDDGHNGEDGDMTIETTMLLKRKVVSVLVSRFNCANDANDSNGDDDQACNATTMMIVMKTTSMMVIMAM